MRASDLLWLYLTIGGDILDRQQSPRAGVAVSAAGKDLGGRRPTFTDSQIRSATKLIKAGEPATQVARNFKKSRATLYRRIQQLPSPTN